MAVALHRNRDFMLLQAGQLLSGAGSQSTTVAYPLLALAVTHSAAQTGLVGFARVLPATLLALPAGIAADRWSRKHLMIGADVVRLVALAGLAAAILAGDVDIGTIVAVAVVEGVGTSVFATAQAGAIRGVVPAWQLPAATNAQTGRDAVVRMGAPPLGGVLFGLSRALPFLVDAVSYACSTLSLLALRSPFQEARTRIRTPLRDELTEGFVYLWRRPFLRSCAALFALGNFTGPGLLLALVVVGRRQGLSSGAVGALVAVFGASLLIGSLAAPFVRRRLSMRDILILEAWTWVGPAVFVAFPNAYVLAAALVPTSLAIPSTDSVVHGYRIATTPDRLLGRSESTWRTMSLVVAPLGPLASGLLLGSFSARAAIAVFAACGLAIAVYTTVSAAIREAPRLDDLSATPVA